MPDDFDARVAGMVHITDVGNGFALVIFGEAAEVMHPETARAFVAAVSTALRAEFARGLEHAATMLDEREEGGRG